MANSEELDKLFRDAGVIQHRKVIKEGQINKAFSMAVRVSLIAIAKAAAKKHMNSADYTNFDRGSHHLNGTIDKNIELVIAYLDNNTGSRLANAESWIDGKIANIVGSFSGRR